MTPGFASAERANAQFENAVPGFESERMEPLRGKSIKEPTSYGPTVKSVIDNMRKRDGDEPLVWKSIGTDRWLIDYDAMYARQVERDRANGMAG